MSKYKTLENIIWFTAFYEGEGYICNDKSSQNRIRLGIDQNDDTPLKLAQKIWGGSIRKRTRVMPSGKICHGNTWCLSHNYALVFIYDILPYMKIPYKINQVEHVLTTMFEKSPTIHMCKYCKTKITFANAANRRRHERNFH